MGSAPPLLTFLLMIVSGWVHRHQLIVIEFLQAENRMLKEKLRGKRIRFTDAERALLDRKAKAVGRKTLLELDTIVSPDTLMRWHRRLVAQKWDLGQAAWPGTAWDHGRDLSADRSHGARQSELGLHPDSRRVGESQLQGGTGHGRQRIEVQRHRACAGARKAHQMVHLFEGALEGLGCERLLLCGGLDDKRADDALRALRDHTC